MRMKSHNNQKNQKKLGSRPTKTFKLIDSDDIDEAFDVTLTLSDNSTKRYELFRFDLADNMSNDEFVMDLDRETLRGLADFILKYLENK